MATAFWRQCKYMYSNQTDKLLLISLLGAVRQWFHQMLLSRPSRLSTISFVLSLSLAFSLYFSLSLSLYSCVHHTFSYTYLFRSQQCCVNPEKSYTSRAPTIVNVVLICVAQQKSIIGIAFVSRTPTVYLSYSVFRCVCDLCMCDSDEKLRDFDLYADIFSRCFAHFPKAYIVE